MIQSFLDWLLERRIQSALRHAMKLPRGTREKAQAWARLSVLVDQRSPQQSAKIARLIKRETGGR